VTRALALAILLALSLGARGAAAHALGVSRGEYRVTPAGVAARLSFDAGELGSVDPVALERRISKRVHVARGGTPCESALLGVEPTRERPPNEPGERAGVTLRAQFTCVSPGPVHVELAFWDELRPGHRHLAGGAEGARVSRAVAFAGLPRFELNVPGSAGASDGSTTEPPRAPSGFFAWLRLGVEHILSGYDHLLFLFSLLLVSSDLRGLLAVISTFTLAHATTLVLAATGLWALPPSIVEPLIALSIGCVALDNIRAPGRPARRAVVFAFGLIHGFGFAGALRELGLDALDNAPALLAFNLGVELGQLALAAICVPALRHCARHPAWRRRVVPAVSGVIALVGVFWFVERVASLEPPAVTPWSGNVALQRAAALTSIPSCQNRNPQTSAACSISASSGVPWL
jgi:hydrogenase/urease accessory protein HupE